jgi:dimethylhistidine N-methyltransferase
MSGMFGTHETFALDVLAGLSEQRKSIPSKYMYDDAGSELFLKITQLPEYYVTQCELDSLHRNVETIAGYVSDGPFNLVEFGPGDERKPSILIDHFRELGCDFRYVPIDISSSAIGGLINDMQVKYPELEIQALVTDYFSGVKWLAHRSSRRNLVLFLGSNIGNFSHRRSRFFLRHLWNCLNNGDIALLGFDLKKDIEMFLAAYNDPQGVTAEFNLNLLRRINRELGGHFDPSQFRHFGTYDVFSGAMESYLVSLSKQDVFIDEIGRSFQFRPWEPIHIEYSYKYLESDIDLLAADTGFAVKEHLYDSRKYFIDSVWEVGKRDVETLTRA